MAEDSGTAAPDPRSPIIEEMIHWPSAEKGGDDPGYRNLIIGLWVGNFDRADRAAGVIRVRVDDATVEKGAAALYAAEGFSNWHESCAPNYYRQRVRAVLEALVTP